MEEEDKEEIEPKANRFQSFRTKKYFFLSFFFSYYL